MIRAPQEAVPFGEIDGREARLLTLQNDVLVVQISDYGGALVSLQAPDRTGRRDHVLLGFDRATGYATSHGSFGAILGRNANRIGGGKISVDGRTFAIANNEPNASLHGGPVGFGKCFWSVVAHEPLQLTLTLTSPDGDQGFPGEVNVTATYRLVADALHLSFDATTTKPTPVTLSAHPYFNLDGLEAADCLDHKVEIFAPNFLPTDEHQIPTGAIWPVAGTPFDFETPHPIGERIRENSPQLRYGCGYDHYFILPEGEIGGIPRLAARVRGNRTGRVLEILTTQPGLQFYTGNNFDGSTSGRGGLYRQSAGFAFEPQGFPDAPNRPNFPSTLLRPDQRYHEEIVYRLSISQDKS
ncbi:MAG: aldose epimerase family protein [Stellaceae bacterium]